MFTPEQIVAEELRAKLYRAQTVRRVQYQTSLWYSLAGSPVARQRLMSRWAPLIEYLAEREIEVDSRDEIDPLHQSDTVNVGR